MKLLVLTQHKVHTAENSIYPLLREMQRHPLCHSVDIASRGIADNFLFFEKMVVKSLYVSPVDGNFVFTPEGRFFEKNLRKTGFADYDAVLLRLPHPVTEGFWKFLSSQFPKTLFINDPLGIIATGTKTFLLNFPELSPPLKHCTSFEEIEEFRKQFPIVLKPPHGYGGKGIVKIADNTVSPAEGGSLTYTKWVKSFGKTAPDFLAVKYLKKVQEGDKRIVVCCGEILGAALRYPRPGSWICNISQGGRASRAEPDVDELEIIKNINHVLEGFGVIFYGIDTLVDDSGKRVLSEINTLSVGGLIRIEEFSKKPATQKAADLLWNYIANKAGSD